MPVLHFWVVPWRLSSILILVLKKLVPPRKNDYTKDALVDDTQLKLVLLYVHVGFCFDCQSSHSFWDLFCYFPSPTDLYTTHFIMDMQINKRRNVLTHALVNLSQSEMSSLLRVGSNNSRYYWWREANSKDSKFFGTGDSS